MDYVAKITKRGQITIPAKIRKDKNWVEGNYLVFSDNTVELHKLENLYDTEWGNYDFRKDVYNDSNLNMDNFNQGREGWPENE